MHSKSPAALSARLTAALTRRVAGRAHGQDLAAARQRQRDLVVAPDADDLLDEIVLLRDVAPEARHDDLEVGARVVHGEAERLEDAHRLLARRATPMTRSTRARRSVEAGRGRGVRVDVDDAAGDRAAAEIGHELGGAVQRLGRSTRCRRRARSGRRRRSAARARARSGGSSRGPSRPLSSSTRVVAAVTSRVGAAHDAADRDGALGIADHEPCRARARAPGRRAS